MTHALLIVAALLFVVLAWTCWELAGICLARAQLGVREDNPNTFRWFGIAFAVLAACCARAA